MYIPCLAQANCCSSCGYYSRGAQAPAPPRSWWGQLESAGGLHVRSGLGGGILDPTEELVFNRNLASQALGPLSPRLLGFPLP